MTTQTEHLPRPGPRMTWLDRASALLSTVAVLGILIGAIVVVVDVLMRWLAGSPVVALNEVMAQVFAMAVAATLPAGAHRRVNLKVDLTAGWVGTRMTAWLSAIGAVMLALFFAILATRIWATGVKFHAQGRETLILEWPLAPTYFVVAAMLFAATALQLVHTLRDIVTAIRTPNERRSTLAGLILVGVTGAMVVGGLVWAVVDWSGMSGLAMQRPGLFAILAFALLWLGVLSQFPLAPVSGLIGLAGTALFIGSTSAANVLASDAVEFLTNPQVATLPLFLLMGSFAVAAGMSGDIYQLANALLGRVRGGLAYTTVAACAGFGAVSGSSVATAATFGRISLPEMRKRNYSPELAAGAVAAGGTLGALVPPSGAIILFALLTEQSITVLFIAAMLPALLALALYFVTIFTVIRLNPDAAPVTVEDRIPILPALKQAAPVAVLFGVVIGGLYGGVFTATESAAVGAVGAFLLALLRGKLNRANFLNVMSETTATTALIYGLIFGALIFSFFINMGQAPELVTRWIAGFDAPPFAILLALLLFYLILGAVMDSFAVMVITVPVVTPLILALGYDIYHWGVLMLVVVEVGLITPPFGINLFVLKSLDRNMAIGRVMRGVLPFVAADIVKIALLALIPSIALWLPSTMQ